MKHAPLPIVLILALPLLAGCDSLMQKTGMQAAPAAAAPPPRPAVMPPAAARSAAAMDTTTEAERAAALAPSAASASLGKVVVALGPPAEPGFWLRSSLVSAERPGRVETAGGKSANVTLLPGSGAASLSLPAFRALGLSLTDLPQVTVYGG
ncbi:hypothetical protein [Cereibacter changlensis]|uniref:hypothetical protein n=1 Tax=Cereibacter changlensis TaxID=402884 RepID=UPI0040349A36